MYMPDEQSVQNQKIAELEKHQAVLDVKLDNITQSIVEIKTNHLVHINDSIGTMNKSILDLGTSMNDKIAQIYSKISDLKISDAKQEPTFNLASKIIEYVLLAVVGAGLALLFMAKK